jgi:hypothetical protein
MARTEVVVAALLISVVGSSTLFDWATPMISFLIASV